MSLNENVADSSNPSNFHNGLNITINGLRNESAPDAPEQNGEPLLTPQLQSQLLPAPALEDCVCPICLEYFIDVVQTGCQHRFCQYCLENWFRISLHRQCPTCRSNIENFYHLPQFQKSICRVIQPELSEDAVQERNRLRLVRQAMLDRANRERERTDALFGRITRNNRLPNGETTSGTNSELATVQGGNLISSHIINWWDDNRLDLHERLRELIRPSTNEVSIEDVPRVWRRFRRQYPEATSTSRGTSQDFQNGDGLRASPLPPASRSRPTSRRSTAATPTTTTPDFLRDLADDSFNETYRRLASEYDNLQYQQNMMEEYNVHMQRLISSYNTIREGYRDFNYHNGRMQQITEEFQSFFERNNASNNGDSPENHVDYEDFEELAEAELNEFIDSLPSGSGRALMREGPSDEEYFNELLRGSALESFAGVGRGSHLRQIRNRFGGLTSPEAARPFNTAGMEQNITSRRRLFDEMSIRMRRFNRERVLVNPRPSARVAPGIISTAGSSVPAPAPAIFLPSQRRESISSRLANTTTGQHPYPELPMPVTSAVSANNGRISNETDSHRQLRRRPHDLNHLTQSEVINDEMRIRRIARRFIGVGRGRVNVSNPIGPLTSPAQHDPNLQVAPVSVTLSPVPETPENESANVINIPIGQISTPTSRPLTLPRDSIVILRNSSSDGEEEQRVAQYFIKNENSTTNQPLPSSSSSFASIPPVLRPLSAPEDRSNRNSLRIFHRTSCGNNMAVSSTPASSTNLSASPENFENRPATARVNSINSTATDVDDEVNGNLLEGGVQTSEPSPMIQITNLNDPAGQDDVLASENTTSLSECVVKILARAIDNSSSGRGP